MARIKNLSCYYNEATSLEVRNIVYVYDSQQMNVYLPMLNRPIPSEQIIQEGDFVNGFKVVKLSNGEYGYVRESDGVLLPYRYDIASDFNELGFAMVGKDGSVSWINKKFEYFTSLFGFKEESDKPYMHFDGFSDIHDFSKESSISKIQGNVVKPYAFSIRVNGFPKYYRLTNPTNGNADLDGFYKGAIDQSQYSLTTNELGEDFILFENEVYGSGCDITELGKKRGTFVYERN